MGRIMSHRWMKFWPADWKGDAALRMCGLAARGLWIECISVMHEAKPYGHLTVNSKALTLKQLASIVGGTEREVVKLLAELEDCGVFSRTADGTIYSRRMVRDHQKSEEGRQAISKRWANKDDGKPPTDEPNTPPNRGPCSLEAEAEADIPPSQTSSVRPPRGCRLPADWKPSPDDAAAARAAGVDLATTAAKFSDYWCAKAGANAVKLDWSATWRNWCRTEAERRHGKPQATPAAGRRSAAWQQFLSGDRPARTPFDLDATAEEATAQ